ncbi:hypothetical protein M9H77_06638 [Catharanthus roseus]|uniref:Uncharacterized protein n=1 Tax=Catharanthus roseus TaxID=4058 RepID=A0ACC0BT20_CATRO|nr:hypothetical protein M9H77_06638 [Catharanthus roseus]
MNQETSLKRSAGTHWGSHYGALINLIIIAETIGLLVLLQTFDFVFTLQLMKDVKITNELSQALQRKDQDITNAMKLIESLLNEVSLFCTTHTIRIPNKEEMFPSKGRSRHIIQDITNLHHYSFSTFDNQNLICLLNFIHLISLILICDEFLVLRGIGKLAEKLVKSGKHLIYPLVYLLINLALILPVAIATVEREFSAMKILKHQLRNHLGDAWMNDCLVTYIEKYVFMTIDNELII